MDLVYQAKQKRLHKMNKQRELHAWYVKDNWIHNKIYTNYLSGEKKIVSYVTTEYINPFPFRYDIEYKGIIHDYDLFICTYKA